MIAASKAAEVARIEAEAQAQASKQRLEADGEAARLLEDHPHLLRLRELEVLREIGIRGGNQFTSGSTTWSAARRSGPACDHLTTPPRRLPRDAVNLT